MARTKSIFTEVSENILALITGDATKVDVPPDHLVLLVDLNNPLGFTKSSEGKPGRRQINHGSARWFQFDGTTIKLNLQVIEREESDEEDETAAPSPTPKPARRSTKQAVQSKRARRAMAELKDEDQSSDIEALVIKALRNMNLNK